MGRAYAAKGSKPLSLLEAYEKALFDGVFYILRRSGFGQEHAGVTLVARQLHLNKVPIHPVEIGDMRTVGNFLRLLGIGNLYSVFEGRLIDAALRFILLHFLRHVFG